MQNRKSILSTLWIFVLLNMIFADIVGFIEPGALENIMAGEVVKGGKQDRVGTREGRHMRVDQWGMKQPDEIRGNYQERMKWTRQMYARDGKREGKYEDKKEKLDQCG